MLCNSLATWFATLYKRAVFLSPYHIIEYYSKGFLQKPLKFQLDRISLSVYNQCLKKPRSPKEAAQYEEQIVHTKVSKSHVLSHYLSSSPPNTLCSYTTYRNQEKNIYAYVSHRQGALFLLTALHPCSSWVSCFHSRQTAVMRCTNNFSRSHFPESFSSFAKRGCG